ncbi:TIGR02186 family protein [Leisingera sp. ANG59]|uniref:TIGR02186 family protein n=1 Tax=Leisingera sp. ANG59 TaxID=2675221 RepID=UPI001573D7E0|nr:TIGR02186 family protein [Leisingera sp. ANG59]NSY41069.1 hypothetical protein [Leisingera sp. ANG59]
MDDTFTMRLILLLTLFLPAAAQAGLIVTRAEPSVIRMGLGFDGATVTVIGAVTQEVQPDSSISPEIVVVLTGPPHSPVLAKMERTWGIWAASPQQRINFLPSYYAIATSRSPTLEFLRHSRLPARIRLQDKLAYANRPRISEDRISALTSLMQSKGTYAELPGAVTVLDDTLFMAQFALPAGISPGPLQVESFLISGGKVIAADNTALVAVTAALPGRILNFLLENAVLYATALIAATILITWAISAVLTRLFP